jgi:LDH2 family malate/lactate/ureidoglycolate dehydrogenase
MEPAAMVKEGELKAFVTEVLERVGVARGDAEIVADVLVLADLRDIGSHGVARLTRYVNGIRSGAMEPTDRSSIVRETATTALVDGGNSLGQVVGHRAMRLAIEKAKAHGVGVVTVRNSNHYGIAGYYALMALEEGLIGWSMTNAFPLVVPTFGRKAVLGTNPISVAAPSEAEPAFVLDMATSVVPRGKLEEYDREGKDVPMGWAVDAAGKGTTNPREVLDNLAARRGGGILPLGGEGELFSGHKGYGLALMVDVLCGVLPGAGFGPTCYGDPKRADVGHFFLALDPAAFRPPEEFRADLDRLLHMMKASPKAEGEARIYTHGEKSFAAMAKRRREGIPLGPKVVEALKKVGEEVGVAWPA